MYVSALTEQRCDDRELNPGQTISRAERRVYIVTIQLHQLLESLLYIKSCFHCVLI